MASSAKRPNTALSHVTKMGCHGSNPVVLLPTSLNPLTKVFIFITTSSRPIFQPLTASEDGLQQGSCSVDMHKMCLNYFDLFIFGVFSKKLNHRTLTSEFQKVLPHFSSTTETTVFKHRKPSRICSQRLLTRIAAQTKLMLCIFDLRLISGCYIDVTGASSW